VISFIIAALVVLAVLWFGQRGLIYFPQTDVPPPAAVGLPQAEPVIFATEDGLTLDGWFVPANSPASGYTIVVFNGNAGHRGHRASLAGQLAARGIAVLLFDYRGYGGNPGLPSEEGLARDARAALAWAGGRPDVDRTRLVLFGESLGTGVAVALAAEREIGALILDAPYTSIADVGAAAYPFAPVRWLLKDPFRSDQRIARVKAPLLMLHGARDNIVPIAFGEKLFSLANQPKHMVRFPLGGHVNLDDYGAAKVVNEFLSAH
jgi:hypothetical protein